MSPGKLPKNDNSATGSFNRICTMRIELLDTHPPIWREVEVPASITLKQHLCESRIDGRFHGPSVQHDRGASLRTEAIRVRLRRVLKPSGTAIEYPYDLGNSWAHRIVVTRIRPGEPDMSYPHYVGGEWDCPPEDCGGIPGPYGMLDTLADPAHAEYLQD